MPANDQIYATSDVCRDIIQSSALFKHSKHVVWEYVENGISYTDEHTNPRVRVSINKAKKSIIIEDNGRGMDKDDLSRFFTAHGENHDRKIGVKTRGKYGTGGISAFGIANLLIVETVKNNKKNIIELSRDYLDQNTGKQQLPLNHKTKDQITKENNGTKITISNIINPAHLSEKAIKQFIEEKIRIRKNAEVYVNGDKCEYIAPSYIKHKVFLPEREEDKILGDIELNVYVASSDLPIEKRGIAISAVNEIHEVYNCCEGKEYSDKIFGDIDVPMLDDEDSPAAFDQSRNGKLNRENRLVQQLCSFISRSVESVRQELVSQEKEKRKEEELKKFRNLDREISNIINEHFAQFSSEFSKTTTKNKGTSDYYPDSNIKDEEDTNVDPGDVLVAGGKIPASFEKSGFLGESNKPIDSQVENGHTILKHDDISPETFGSKTKEGEKTKMPKGGFSVTPYPMGEGERRASYKEQERTIYINLDHPQLKSAYTLSGANVDDEIFKRLYYEVAFTEYVFALIFHKSKTGHYLENDDALSDALHEIDNIARKASKLYR